MTNLVEFPGLGISINVNRVAFSIGGLNIYWYGVFIGFGMLLALLLAFRENRRFGVDADRLIDVVFVGLICAIVGGRLYYVLFDDAQYTSFWQLIDLRSGGIAIYGGIIGAFLGAAVTCKIRKVPLLPVFDLASMGFLIGQSLGRWGNFFNQEAFGNNTTLPWGMISPATRQYLEYNQAKLAQWGTVVDPSMPVHPTFLYESLWCALGFVLLFLYRKHRKFNGEMFLLYLMWYGLGRFFIEGLRTDSLMLTGLGMRVSQLLAGLSVLAALAIWIMARVKTAGKPLKVPPLPLRTAKVKLDVDGQTQTVQISWPGANPDPNREQRLEMAKAAYQKQKEQADTKKQQPPSGEKQQAGEGSEEEPRETGDGANNNAPTATEEGDVPAATPKPSPKSKPAPAGAKKETTENKKQTKTNGGQTDENGTKGGQRDGGANH